MVFIYDSALPTASIVAKISCLEITFVTIEVVVNATAFFMTRHITTHMMEIRSCHRCFTRYIHNRNSDMHGSLLISLNRNFVVCSPSYGSIFLELFIITPGFALVQHGNKHFFICARDSITMVCIQGRYKRYCVCLSCDGTILRINFEIVAGGRRYIILLIKKYRKRDVAIILVTAIVWF